MIKNKTKQCQTCGKDFEKPYNCSVKEWGYRKYCSNSCANKATGLNNGKLYVKGRKPWHAGKKLPQLSVENSPHWEGGEVELVCEYCGENFSVRQYRKNDAKYCSLECKHKGFNRGLSTKNDLIRHGAKYKIWRQAIFEKDDFICQKCGTRGGYLVAHHAKNFAEHPELVYAIDNGVTLCKDCHLDFHKEYGFRNNTEEQLMEYLLEEMLAYQEEE